MDFINIEVKAACANVNFMHHKLIELGADYKGLDHQIDTYFHARNGRLKLRKGTIEHSLIFYRRPESLSLKRSDVLLWTLEGNDHILKRQLEAALGVKVIVDKKRHIYYVDHYIKFHLDDIDQLGTFIEIEVKGQPEEETRLREKCDFYVRMLGIQPGDFIDRSYSDMMLEKV